MLNQVLYGVFQGGSKGFPIRGICIRHDQMCGKWHLDGVQAPFVLFKHNIVDRHKIHFIWGETDHGVVLEGVDFNFRDLLEFFTKFSCSVKY